MEGRYSIPWIAPLYPWSDKLTKVSSFRKLTFIKRVIYTSVFTDTKCHSRRLCCILICRCMHNHNDDTIKTSDTVLRKIYLSFYLKGLWVRGSWRPNRTATYWPPTLLAITAFLSVLLGCSTGGLGPSLSGTCSSVQHLLSNSSDSQLVWSPTLNRGPEGSSCWVLAFSTASCLQLIEFPVQSVI